MSYSASNTYCTVDDVALRLTRYGQVWAADVDSADNTLDDQELQYVEQAIEYANNLIDAALINVRVSLSARPNNAWLNDRAVDIAAFRVMTLGGRDAPVVLKDDYARARQDIDRVSAGTLKVPGLQESIPLDSGRVSYGLPSVANPGGCRRGY